MKNGSFSLRIKILFWVLPIVMLGMLIMSFVAFRYITTIIEGELAESMFSSVGKSADSINRWLNTMMLEPEAIAVTSAAKNINRNFREFDLQNRNRFKALHGKYPDIFQDIYGANRNGIYHTVFKSGKKLIFHEGDIASRHYFISIMKGGPTQITPPLVSRTTGVPTVFIVAPITDKNNRPAGLVGAGLSLKYIQQVVRELGTGKSGYGFIITEDGTFVSHSTQDSVTGRSIYEKEFFSDRSLGERLTTGKQGTFRYMHNGMDMVIFYKKIPVTGWVVASAISAMELFHPATDMIRILMIIIAFTCIVTGISIYYAMGRLVKPLQVLVKKTGEISLGNFMGEDLPVESNDEIGTLSESFNIMKADLNELMTRLRNSEDNYRGIFENSVEGILQTTMEGRMLIVNPAMVRMLHGESADQIVNTYTDIKNQLYANPEDRRGILDKLREEGRIYHEEIMFVCIDSEKIWVSISAFLVRDRSGVPVRIEALVSDISYRKKIEQERERLFQELVQAQKLEAVGQLAGGVAHDFNNMLAVILGRVEIALLTMNRADPHYSTLIEIQDAAEHSVNLTRQLLAFARKQAVSPEIIDINAAIKGMFKLLKRLISEDIKLSFVPGEGVWAIFMDPDQAGQILANLCVNARDSITGNGIITIRTENRIVEEADSVIASGEEDFDPGEYVCISVEDNGSGMDENIKKHIFEPFFTTKKLGKGTGLGLSTIYGIVKQNGGFVNVYSEKNQGTVFRIYLPRSSKAGSVKSEDIQEEIKPVSVKTVLLVEDDPRLLGISRIILEKLGCTVFTAVSAAEALRFAGDLSCDMDMVITDVIMPEMNGYDLAKRVEEIRPGIKTIFMSGYSSDILAPKGILAEGINFIQKPFTLRSLSEKINEVMGTS